MIKNYTKLKKVLKNAISVNFEVNKELEDYDAEDIRYFFMEDPDFYVHFGNYKAVTENVLKKIK